jgi:hypothetical protein
MYWQFTALLIWPIVIWNNAFRQKVAHRQQQLKRKQQQQKMGITNLWGDTK